MRKILNWLLAATLICGATAMLTACSANDDNPSKGEKTSADLVVYGKIFTSEDNQVVEAFAVKDGKYVYVGGKDDGEGGDVTPVTPEA